MNRIILVAIISVLAACGSKKEEKLTAAVSSTGAIPAGAEILSHTEAYDEATVLAAAASLANTGYPLGAKSAEQCWESEAKRIEIRNACVLAWAVGSEESAILENVLRSISRRGGQKLRALAIACIRKTSVLRTLDIEDLIGMFVVLQNDPPWLRSLAVHEWLKTHSPIDPVQAARLWSAVNFDAESSSDPMSLSTAYSVAVQLGLPHAAQLLGSYCNPIVSGLAGSRCWRFLSLLIDPRTGQGLDRSSLPFLPPKREWGWTLFERSFPERASLVERYF